MNNEIKLSVSIVLPGSTKFTQAEAKQLEKTQKGTGFDYSKIKIRTKKNKFEDATIRTRKTKTATQIINMSNAAYEYFISDSSNIMRKWSLMGKKQRLEAHLKLLCESLGGLSFTYKVFDN